jgi:hypothetical protein
MMREFPAAVGFTVKSGWATAVLVSGPSRSPRVLDACTIQLSDPAIPESRQPYHAGFGTARGRGPELSRLVASVEQFGRQTVTGLIRRYLSEGYPLHGAGIVVGSTIDPERIANDHIRIHALEGQLFRRVVEESAAESSLACSIWRNRDLYPSAASILKEPESHLRGTLATLGKSVAGSWRAEQKAATLAAWLVLAAGAPGGRTMSE